MPTPAPPITFLHVFKSEIPELGKEVMGSDDRRGLLPLRRCDVKVNSVPATGVG